jgi:hypothetical protein
MMRQRRVLLSMNMWISPAAMAARIIVLSSTGKRSRFPCSYVEIVLPGSAVSDMMSFFFFFFRGNERRPSVSSWRSYDSRRATVFLRWNATDAWRWRQIVTPSLLMFGWWNGCRDCASSIVTSWLFCSLAVICLEERMKFGS